MRKALYGLSRERSQSNRRAEFAARRRIDAGDIRLALSLPVYFLLAWLLPERLWAPLCRGLAAIGPTRNSLIPRIARFGAVPGGRTPEAIVRALEAGRREHYLQILRAYRPGGWRPDLAIEGLEHLDAALAGGKGALLWVDHFVFNGLAPKQALFEAGRPFFHVSRPEHGFSKTAFGVRFLNPVRRRIEDRFLAGRIVIERGREAATIREIRRRLAEGHAVSITAGAWEGRRIAEVPFFGGLMPLATGAPRIAAVAGTPLLPLAVIRDPVTGRLSVIIEPPLREHGMCDRESSGREEPAEALLEAYARRLEPRVAAASDQWRGWNYLRPAGGES